MASDELDAYFYAWTRSFHVAEMENVCVSAEFFMPDDPNNSAMAQVHCRA